MIHYLVFLLLIVAASGAPMPMPASAARTATEAKVARITSGAALLEHIYAEIRACLETAACELSCFVLEARYKHDLRNVLFTATERADKYRVSYTLDGLGWTAESIQQLATRLLRVWPAVRADLLVQGYTFDAEPTADSPRAVICWASSVTE